MTEYRQDKFDKKKFKTVYDKCRNKARIFRNSVKCECTESTLAEMIDQIKYLESDVLKTFQSIAQNELSITRNSAKKN